MSYRRNSEPKRLWQRWLKKNKDALEKCGLPEIVLTNETHWWDFLLHGYLDHNNDPGQFKVNDLSKQQMQSLADFLETELSEEEKSSAIVLLQIKTLLNEDQRR